MSAEKQHNSIDQPSNMTDEWSHGICDGVCGGDCATCMGAFFCTCCLFGRVDQRLKRFPDEGEFNNCNGPCWLMCGASVCYVPWLPQMLKRADVRRRFGIKGDGGSDCLMSFCCAPCSLAQMDMELKERAKKGQGAGGLGNGNAGQYVPPAPQQGMTYQPNH